MEAFEINSLLRLLRSSIKAAGHQSIGASTSTASKSSQQPPHHQTGGQFSLPNPAASTTNFIASGQRFETLKTLRRQLRRHFADLSRSSSQMSFHLLQSIFDTLKSTLTELVTAYYEHMPPTAIPPQMSTKVPTIRKASISVETVFAAAVQRNEILEIIQILIEVVSKCSVENLAFSEAALKKNTNFMSLQEDCHGRMFLPEIIVLLGEYQCRRLIMSNH